jgi:hypothetical protein
VDWTEVWIRGLIAFHVLLWVLVLGFRKNMTLQTTIFFFICGAVAISERVNTLLRERYWQVCCDSLDIFILSIYKIMMRLLGFERARYKVAGLAGASIVCAA